MSKAGEKTTGSTVRRPLLHRGFERCSNLGEVDRSYGEKSLQNLREAVKSGLVLIKKIG